jgi:hypothetical protein
MMSIRSTIGIVAAASLVGCSQLGVRVEVLDPGYAHRVVAEGSLQLIYFSLQTDGPTEASRPVREAADKIIVASRKLADAYIALANASPADATALRDVAQDLRDSVGPGGFVERRASDVSRDLDAAGVTALRAAVDARWTHEQAMPAALRAALAAIQALRSQYGRDRQLEVQQLQRQARIVEQRLGKDAAKGGASPVDAANAKTVVQELASVAGKELRSLIGDGSLAGSEYAFIVAKAPASAWAESFNRAAASANLGNSDFVIKMNSLGDFTVKGMRFDASSVAKVASKVATQSLLIGAQMAGVPLPTANAASTGDGAALASASGQLAANDALVAKRKASFDAWRQAVREMASAVLAEDATLRTVAPTWTSDKAMVTAPITTSFTALTPVLNLGGVE